MENEQKSSWIKLIKPTGWQVIPGDGEQAPSEPSPEPSVPTPEMP